MKMFKKEKSLACSNKPGTKANKKQTASLSPICLPYPGNDTEKNLMQQKKPGAEGGLGLEKGGLNKLRLQVYLILNTFISQITSLAILGDAILIFRGCSYV